MSNHFRNQSQILQSSKVKSNACFTLCYSKYLFYRTLTEDTFLFLSSKTNDLSKGHLNPSFPKFKWLILRAGKICLYQ